VPLRQLAHVGCPRLVEGSVEPVGRPVGEHVLGQDAREQAVHPADRVAHGHRAGGVAVVAAAHGQQLRAPAVAERFAIALDHARMADAYELDQRGAAIEFRKHLGWYVKGLPGSAELRKRLHAVTSLMEVEGIFADYLAAVARGDVDQRRASERDAETLAA